MENGKEQWKEHIGKRYWGLVVESYWGNTKGGKRKYILKCDCGNFTKPTVLYDVKSGKTKSCGCIRRETRQNMCKQNIKHGDASTRLWILWQSMKARCNRVERYIKRNITVCEEWEDYINFKEWAILNGYRDDLTLDRISNSNGYSPDNCRWATMKEQQNNKTNNRIISIDGISKTLSQWADEKGIGRATISWRIKNGWSDSELFIKADFANKQRKKV